MSAPFILSAALAATAPPERTPPDDFEIQLDDVELIPGADDVQLIAYDSAGEVIGTIAIWVEPDGRFHLASDYGDGYAETVVADGRVRVEATLPPEVAVTRADAMLETLDYRGRDGLPKGALGCAVTVAAATALCAPLAYGQVWGAVTCAAGVVSAWCKCAPVVGINEGAACEQL